MLTRFKWFRRLLGGVWRNHATGEVETYIAIGAVSERWLVEHGGGAR